jgi:2-polyprenyl-3-methyl-5-hydroxy-6-metoxy-1,4-benzoquinol methylase
MLDFHDQFHYRHKKNLIRESQMYNMVIHPDEPYYCDQYWYWIENALSNFINDNKTDGVPLHVLDLGCGQGRLTIPLAKWCLNQKVDKVIGVDISALAIDFARKYAAIENLDIILKFKERDILEFLREQEAATFGVVLCTEVLYNISEYTEVLIEISRTLKHNGLFLAAFRSRYSYVLDSIDRRRWTALPVLLNQSDGFPLGPPTRFSWHNTQEIKDMLTGNGFDVRSLKGIGIFSGTAGEPLSKIARPSLLSAEDQKELMKVELALAEEMADCGRYIFVEAIKP